MNREEVSGTRPGAETAPSHERTPDQGEGDLPLPVGTLFLMMLYIMVLAGMWGAIFFEFIGR